MMKFKGRLKMNLDKIKLDLVKLIKNKKGVSFVEIEIYLMKLALTITEI